MPGFRPTKSVVAERLSLWSTRCLTVLLVGWICATARANDTELQARLEPLIATHKGQVAVAVKLIENGRGFAYRETEPMPTASLIKLPVMVEAYRQAELGKLHLDSMVTLKSEDKVPGSGVLTSHFSPGMTFTVRDAIRLMIAFSDNTATNLVVDQIGLPSTASTMEQMGFSNTKLHSKVFRGDSTIFPERSARFGLGSTTAAEMIQLLERLQRRELVSPAASEEMLKHLEACDDKDRFPRFLPPGTKVAHKTGSVAKVRTAAGIISSPAGSIALCVLTTDNQDQRWAADNAGNVLCAEIARAVYDTFNPKSLDDANGPRSELRQGDTGELVMALQRTLNERSAPSPQLSIDGEFGPSTQSAVMAFQKQKKLDPTGEVADATWAALSPLLVAAAPVPEPEAVNNEVLDLKPADSLSGPPLVTADAWAIADAKTGAILWGSQTDLPLEIASTTKVMTAYITLSLADRDPKVLDELVTVSENADQTEGSSAAVRAGEKLPVREMLYGLLLPSGNDAAVVLAEHFGNRFEAEAPGQGKAARFIAEMNRTAKSLGMIDTKFMNPHGLPDRKHVSSARDLVKVTSAAEKFPLFCEIVKTRQRGYKLTGKGGYQRNVVWKNTNRLLEISGFGGVKTGTTRAAGSCLISSGERDADRLYVIVLGATTNESRYIDARNLFKWAWLQRGHKDP